MSLKTIKVNPLFLGTSGIKSSKHNKTRKEKPAGLSMGASNNIKKKLIARVKDFQKAKLPDANANNSAIANTKKDLNITSSAMNDTFGDSVNFLDNLARGNHDKKRDKRERKMRKQHNSTIKQKHQGGTNLNMNIATELPPELDWNIIAPPAPALAPALAPAAVMTAAAPVIAPAPAPAPLPVILAPPAAPGNWNSNSAPAYSNLKTGGSKPTYRTWLRNTQKNKHIVETKPQTISILEDVGTNIIPEIDIEPLVPAAPAAPLAAAPLAAAPLAVAPAAPLAVAPAAPLAAAAHVYVPSMRPKRKRITRTLKYKLGKHADGKVSILIKNAQTRRKVQTEQAQLKQKNILEIKNFLRSKNLLKAGSEAPNDVLRHLYEQSILAGLVENKSKENLIHNFFNNEK